MQLQEKTESYLLFYKSFAIHKRKLGKVFHALWIGSLVSPRAGLNTPLQRSAYMHTPAGHRNLVVNPVRI